MGYTKGIFSRTSSSTNIFLQLISVINHYYIYGDKLVLYTKVTFTGSHFRKNNSKIKKLVN